MPKVRERGFPLDPEPLPIPVADNHTHLDHIALVLPKEVEPAPKEVEPVRRFAPQCSPRPRSSEQVRSPRATSAPETSGTTTGGFDPFDRLRDHLNLLPSEVSTPSTGSGTGSTSSWPPTVADHLRRAAAAGVDRVVQVGCDLDSAEWTSGWLLEDQAVTGSAGAPAARALGAVAIHPNEAVLHARAHDVGPDGWEARYETRHDAPLDEAVACIAALAASTPRIRAIGETGLDYFRTGPRGAAAQRESFRAHIALAKELGLALQIHDRDAHEDVVAILLADGAPERTVFHCFSGAAAMARLASDNGWYLSVAGPITYKANDALREAVRAVPLSRLLVETDAPYLTPHPFRGQPNAPYVVAHTVAALADVLERPLAEVCRTVSETSNEVYGPW